MCTNVATLHIGVPKLSIEVSYWVLDVLVKASKPLQFEYTIAADD